MTSRRPSRTAAFTLLELVVVLAILSVVSLLAAHSLHNAQDQHRAAAADRLLDDIRDAVLPVPPGRAATAAEPALPCGFLGDLGRLPRAMPATNADGAVTYTLSELYARPADVPAFALLALDAAHVCPSSPATFDPTLDDAVSLPVGWRGPYLSRPTAASADDPTPRDAWGSPLSSSPLDPFGMTNRLSTDGTFTDPRPFAPVAYVRHLGADLAPAGTPYAVSNAFHADNVLSLAHATNAVAVATYDVPTNAAATRVAFRLYLPCPCARDAVPRAHILSQTVAASPGAAAIASFAPVPAGWHLVAAAPEGEPLLRRTFWTYAQ